MGIKRGVKQELPVATSDKYESGRGSFKPNVAGYFPGMIKWYGMISDLT